MPDSFDAVRSESLPSKKKVSGYMNKSMKVLTGIRYADYRMILEVITHAGKFNFDSGWYVGQY